MIQLDKIPLSFLLLILLLFNRCANDIKRVDSTSRPNILFAIADDVSFPHMSAYGCNWIQTPAFDRVADNGLLFTNAYTPNAKCAPSRSCLITGRNSWQLEAAANHVPYFPEKFKTYPEVLKENGYFTGYTGKGWAPGNPGEVDGKKRQLLGEQYNDRKLTPPTPMISNVDYASNFKDFLDQRPEGEPFCFWYGGFEPHRFYEYGSGIKKGGKQLSMIDDVPDYWPDNDTVKTDMLDYAYEIEYFDSHLEKMLNTLEERGELENTIVIVTADNGMPFPRAKGSEYEVSNHMPFAVMWPNGIKNPGRTIEDYVSFIDLAPTYLELAGIPREKSGMQSITGRSLGKIFYSESSGKVTNSRDHVLIGKERHDIGRPHDWGYPIRGIIKGDYLYLKNFKTDRYPHGNPETGYLNTDGGATKTQVLNYRRRNIDDTYWDLCFGKRPSEELYNIKNDPDCMKNLADDPDYQARKKSLSDELILELEEQEDPRIFGNGDVFDNYPYAQESMRNFYERYVAQGEDIEAGWVNKSDFEPKPITQ